MLIPLTIYCQSSDFKTGDKLILQLDAGIYKKPKTIYWFNNIDKGYSVTIVNNEIINGFVLIDTNMGIGYIKVNYLYDKNGNVIKSDIKSLEYSNHKTIQQNLSPGDYLIKSKNQMLTGIGLNIIGTGIVYKGIKIDLNENKNSEPIIALGIATIITGFFLEITGITNIDNAGIELNKNIIGIKIPINSKK